MDACPSPDLLRSEPDGAVARRRADAARRDGEAGEDPVGRRSASYWRTQRDAAGHRARGSTRPGLSLWLLRFSVRGWNRDLGPEPSPRPRRPVGARRGRARPTRALPVVLLGHSMGARTAVARGRRSRVVGVVGPGAVARALGDPVAPLAGRHLVAGHGSRDRITSAGMTRRYVERARAVAASAEFVDVGRLGHYMLARPARWNRFAVQASLEVLARDARGYRATGRPRPRHWLRPRPSGPPMLAGHDLPTGRRRDRRRGPRKRLPSRPCVHGRRADPDRAALRLRGPGQLPPSPSHRRRSTPSSESAPASTPGRSASTR